MRFINNGELKDEKIILELHRAADQYQNGELSEVRDLLMEIVDAIDEFTEEWE